MTERKKRNIVIGALCGVLLLMAIGYAAFSSILNIKGTTNISSNWDIRITNVESKNIVGSASNAEDPEWDNLTATFKTNLEVPGDSIEYDVTVENKGTLNAKLDKINMTSSNNPAIKFTATGLKEGDKLNAGSSAILTVKVEYLTGVEVDDKNLSASLTVTLDYVQSNVGEGGIATVPGSDTLIENVVTEGDGLYEDEYETGRYIYRGANPNNYITFNGETAGWRIISVETDGTLKIMKDASIGTMQFDPGYHRELTGVKPSSSVTGTRYSSDSLAYCSANPVTSYNGCNIWGSASTMLDANGNNIAVMPREIGETNFNLPESEAYLNTYLNTEYYNTLSSEAKSQIDYHLWNIGLIADKGPTFETDVEQEKAYKWRGKVGLVNPTDYIKASTDAGCTRLSDGRYVSDGYCKNNNYLEKGSYWTISPLSYGFSFIWNLHGDGKFGTSVANGDYGTNLHMVFPVIYLTSDISLSGSGTQADPYTIN